MRKLYSVLAWLVAGGVVVQSAAIAFAFGGVLNRVSEGSVLDTAALEGGQGGGEPGSVVHALVGGVVIPVLALALLVVSFFVRTRGAKLWAAIVFGLVVMQVALGYAVADVPFIGTIHGAVAIAIVATASMSARRVGERRTAGAADAGSEVEGADSDAVQA
ncbi:hypothetical protein [Agromyces sp. H66]|uniref:hypothetical protein n=1 Tax=Agromyces sp. H66 TaxID=2529859 RepID=UPI0010AAE365|nr:hypothetical protein [Agromyces sp. H66]